jgi:DNA repair exonuclease SbcCD nuclease subunit
MKKIKYLIHVADIHIKSYQRHTEYREILSNFIESAGDFVSQHRDETRIILAGDIMDNFLNITNELEVFVAWFLKEVDRMGVTVIIAGNHDLTRNNMERMDSISPFFHTMDLPNTTYFDMQTSFRSACLIDGNIIWALYSIFDEYAIPDIEKARKENPGCHVIGLFHGPVTGAKTDTGFTVDHGVSPDIFNGCDFVVMGDIHKRQLMKNKNGVPLYYSGSLVQKNFGETVGGHGYSVISLPDFNIDFHEVENPYPFYTFRINSPEDIENGQEVFLNSI